MIEAALTLLLLFGFLVSIFEGGRLFQTQQTLTQAAREGARYSVTPLTRTSTLPDIAAVQDRVRAFLQASSVAGATVLVEQDVTLSGTTYSRVTVSYTHRMIFAAFGLPDVGLSGQSLMRNETSP